MPRLSKGAISWAFYDLANSAFALIVIAGFFGPFYRDYWSGGSDQSLFWQGITVSFASLLVAVMAPFLGAIADHRHVKKVFLCVFMLLGALATAGFFFVGKGHWQLASFIYILAFIGFAAGNIFYDSLLLHVSDDTNRHFTSSLGFALGYGGSVLLFIANMVIVNNPTLLGFSDNTMGIKVAFLSVSIWWMVFSLPVLLTVKESRSERQTGIGHAVWGGIIELRVILKEVVKRPTVLWFLVAYWLYIDGVNTLITMATGFGHSLGFTIKDLMMTLIIVQVTGVPFTIIFGLLGQSFGARKLILTGIVIYLGVTLYAARLSIEPVSIMGVTINEIYILGFLVGMVQGSIQSLSRSFFASIIPPDRAAAYFGFYNMVGKFAALLGPALMGTVARVSGSPRMGMLAVALLFLLGGICLLKVSNHKST